MPIELQNKMTDQELKEQKERCRWQKCKCKARFEDWTGSQFCTSHMWFIFKNSEHKLFGLKHMKIIL